MLGPARMLPLSSVPESFNTHVNFLLSFDFYFIYFFICLYLFINFIWNFMLFHCIYFYLRVYLFYFLRFLVLSVVVTQIFFRALFPRFGSGFTAYWWMRIKPNTLFGMSIVYFCARFVVRLLLFTSILLLLFFPDEQWHFIDNEFLLTFPDVLAMYSYAKDH